MCIVSRPSTFFFSTIIFFLESQSQQSFPFDRPTTQLCDVTVAMRPSTTKKRPNDGSYYFIFSRSSRSLLNYWRSMPKKCRISDDLKIFCCWVLASLGVVRLVRVSLSMARKKRAFFASLFSLSFFSSSFFSSSFFSSSSDLNSSPAAKEKNSRYKRVTVLYSFVKIQMSVLILLFLSDFVMVTSAFDPLPEGSGQHEGTRTGLNGVVDDFLDPSKNAGVVAKYGPIEDWDVSGVTNFQGLFYNRNDKTKNPMNFFIGFFYTSNCILLNCKLFLRRWIRN